MMTKQERDEWVAALRSGLYAQGRFQLCTVNDDGTFAYCCLGVKARLDADSGKITDEKRSNDGTYITFKYPDDNQMSAGFISENIVNLSDQSELSLMNDQQGKSFAKIADWIEKHVPVEINEAST